MSTNRDVCIFIIVTLFIVVTYSCNYREFPTGIVCVCSKEKGCDEFPPFQRVKSRSYDMYTSSKGGDRFKKQTGECLNSTRTNPNATLTIYRDTKMQEIHGFGGAFTDAAGFNILSLSDDTTDMLMRSYYSEAGLQYSMGRVPIGGSDFSPRGYTYDDESDDCNLKSFSLQPEDFSYKIPLIKKAIKLTDGDLKLVGTAWTAPAWMKTNNRLIGIGFLKISMYDLWADYHIKFLDAYDKEGIKFWALTTGNEPNNGLLPFIAINDMGWVPDYHGKWICENLGPKIRLHDNYNEIKILIIDDQRSFFPWVAEEILETCAEPFVDGLAVHYYTDQDVSADVLTLTHYKFPDKFILATEASEGALAKQGSVLGSWARAENYLNSIMDDLNNWATGWMDWNIALNIDGGPTYVNNTVDSPIIVNKTSDEFYKQPMFYAIGHFSKFLRPKSVRIKSTYSGTDLKTVVFQRPDKEIVASIFNPTDVDVTMYIKDKHSEDCNDMEITVKSHSINSVIYW